LNRVIKHARASAFYRERLPTSPLRSPADLKRIPILTKDDVRRQSPHGLVCVPREELLQYHESSATTGKPVSVWFSKSDLAEIGEHFSRWGVGFKGGDRVLVRFPYALSSSAHLVQAAAQHAGACVVPADSATNITPLPRVVELMQKLQVSVLATISFSAVMLAEAAEMLGFSARHDFPHLRAICCAGEPLTRHRRELLEALWGVPVYDNYGMTEAGPLAMDCEERQMHPWEQYFWLEILDDRLENEVDPGKTGQLVVTTLATRATPMIRYLTGDRVRRLPQRCECGQSSTLQIRGRSDDTLWIGGTPFDLWKLEAIVSQFPSRRFWRVAPLQDGLSFVVEKERDDDRIEPSILEGLERIHGTRLKVDLVPKGTLYNRKELVSFGMAGKPVYVEPLRP
jgi:phenylacetate-CoA ligase